MTETPAHGYSSEITIYWIPTRQDLDGFQDFLRPCALDESRLSIGRVKSSPKRSQKNHVAILNILSPSMDHLQVESERKGKGLRNDGYYGTVHDLHI